MPRTPSILGVDDNARNLDILRRTLQPRYALTTAQSGEEALGIAARLRPELVLLDIMMPGLDGYETCRRLRADKTTAHAKVIMVSAKAATSERLEGYAAGADDYIAKPFDPDELLAKVRVYLRLARLEEVERLKSSMLTLFNHETRTPLTNILTPLPLLLEDPALTADQRVIVETVEQGAQRLLKLVNTVAFLSRLSAGPSARELDVHDLAAIAREAVASASPRAAAARVTLALARAEPCPVRAESAELTWVVEALLDNAVRFSPAGETIEIRAWQEGDRAHVAVSDHGPGVDPEVRPWLFQEFVVADIGHHTAGLGLSLAAVRAIVEQLGGTVGEASPERGATFRISIPLATAPVAVA
jgi:signal transduction histidine kinase